MASAARTGFPVVGVIFLTLAGLKLVQDEDWVVWAILGVLFGGTGIFSRTRSGGGDR
jgi:hypothetical protein